MSETAKGIGGFVRDHFKTLLALVGGYVALVETGNASYPTIPEGSGVLVLAGLVVAPAGYIAAGKIDDLLPDPPGVFIVEFDASSDQGGAVYELTEDQFDAMEVHAGSLFQWPTSKRAYEVREYRPEDNVAVANWRESVAGSELAGHVQVVDALEAIGELRDEFEPEAQRFRIVQRRLRSVARKMDRRRDRDQQAIIEPHLAPEFGNEETATVSDILNEEMPDHLLPNSMRAEEQAESDHGDESGEFAGFEILDDMDAEEPQDPLYND